MLSIMPCYAVSCFAVSCCAVLCCAVLCYAVPGNEHMPVHVVVYANCHCRCLIIKRFLQMAACANAGAACLVCMNRALSAEGIEQTCIHANIHAALAAVHSVLVCGRCHYHTASLFPSSSCNAYSLEHICKLQLVICLTLQLMKHYDGLLRGAVQICCLLCDFLTNSTA